MACMFCFIFLVNQNITNEKKKLFDRHHGNSFVGSFVEEACYFIRDEIAQVYSWIHKLRKRKSKKCQKNKREKIFKPVFRTISVKNFSYYSVFSFAETVL